MRNKPFLKEEFRKIITALAIVAVAIILIGQGCSGFSSLKSISNVQNSLNSPSGDSTCTTGVTTTGQCVATTAPTPEPVDNDPTPDPDATAPSATGSVSLAGSNQTTVPFGSGFQKFVYSAPLPGLVNYTGLSGKVTIDSNSPFFSEALFTIGYSPNGNCPASGSTYMDYGVLFGTMPGSQILQQYIIKIVGGHLELPTEYELDAPVPVSGCAFVIMDGDAGYKGSTDTMANTISFNYKVGDQDPQNLMFDAAGGEYCYGLSKGCTFSSTNQFKTVSKVPASGVIASLTGSISAAPLYIYKSTSLPAGAWTVHNRFYIDPQCANSAGTGVSVDQDFFSQVPANAVQAFDLVQNAAGGSAAQQSVNQSLDLPVQAGDCIVQLLQVSGAGPIDIEVQMKANLGHQN